MSSIYGRINDDYIDHVKAKLDWLDSQAENYPENEPSPIDKAYESLTKSQLEKIVYDIKLSSIQRMRNLVGFTMNSKLYHVCDDIIKEEIIKSQKENNFEYETTFYNNSDLYGNGVFIISKYSLTMLGNTINFYLIKVIWSVEIASEYRLKYYRLDNDE